MATSNSRDFNLNRSQLVTAALRKLRVVDEGNAASSAQMQDGVEALNLLIASWQNEGIFLWQHKEYVLPLVAAQRTVQLPSDIFSVDRVFFRQDGDDTEVDIMEYHEYAGLENKKEAGDPYEVYIDYQRTNPTMYMYPVIENSTAVVFGTDGLPYTCIKDHTSAAAYKPVNGASYATYWERSTSRLFTTTWADSTVYAVDDIVTGSDGNYYVCKLAHTSATANDKPITGTNYATYWEQIYGTPVAVATWATSTSYYSNCLVIDATVKMQDFDDDSDTPDMPVRAQRAVVWSLAADLAPEFGLSPTYYEQKAAFEFTKLKNSLVGKTDIRIQPRMR